MSMEYGRAALDLAEAVDDLICTFEGGESAMDTLAMFIFIWALAALLLFYLAKFLYEKYQKRTKAVDATAAKTDPALKTTAVAGTTTTPTTKINATDAVDTKVSAAPLAAASGKGKGYVPPTPPVRKRLTRASPGPDLSRKTRFIPAPQCTGADNVSVLWVNEVFQWLYNDLVIVNELLGVWLQSLNEHSRKASAEQGVTVEFVRLLPETHPPTLSNVFCECDTKDDVTITCDCEAYPAFQLKCTRQKGDKSDISHYRVNVNRFRARLNIFCVSEKLQADIKCDGWPEIKISLAPVGNIKNTVDNLDETQLQDVLSEIISAALRSCEVHLNLAIYPTCPRLVRHIAPPGHILPVHYDSMLNAYTSTPNNMGGFGAQRQGDKRLLVKVIRANQLGSTQGCSEPFCVVEMDEPPQKNQTSIQKNTNSPYWDEHFLFDLSPNTAELLFEVYDHAVKPHRFLGLGIVGVEELLINPSQRQIISLQSRPYESDPVSGTLTVEFLFIEGADIPQAATGRPYKIKESIRSLSPTRAQTMDPYHRSPSPLRNGNHLHTPNARDMSSQPWPSMKQNNNTLIIHSVQRQPSQRLVKVELSNGTWKEIERVENVTDDNNDEVKEVLEKVVDTLTQQEEGNNKSPSELEDSGKTATTASDESNKASANGNVENGEFKNGNALNGSDSIACLDDKGGDFMSVSNTGTLQSQGALNDDNRGRSRKRRDFFGTIKRRLGKSKTRSKSAGPEDEMGRDDSLSRSLSADRNRGINDGYRLNVPPGMRPDLENSRRSSLSEASGLSSASTRTYINEASTLVLETIENGIKKHYLVPLSLAQKSKWRKKGTKLHIFNDHTFIAKHLTGGTVCQVCSKSIARRIGKQGYECRDCLLKCHKHCHVKVNDNCPQSTIHNIELSYITNPLTDKNLRIL